MIELYEQSIEIICFNEELNKKTDFRRICEWMKHNKPKAPDACCGGGSQVTPEEVVQKLIPKMNETLFEILGEAPFLGQTKITTEAGVPLEIKVEQLILSILNYTNSILGESAGPRLKISLQGNVKGVAITDTIRKGDVLSITGKMEKKRGIKEDKHSWRSFVALVNKTNNRVAVDEYE